MASLKVIDFMKGRCIGESPPIYGGKKAYAYIAASFKGRCLLNYAIDGENHSFEFDDYQQARTAATMAIFSQDIDFVSVNITASYEKELAKKNLTAKMWYAWLYSRTAKQEIRLGA